MPFQDSLLFKGFTLRKRMVKLLLIVKYLTIRRKLNIAINRDKHSGHLKESEINLNN
jgi:hypothetical protein